MQKTRPHGKVVTKAGKGPTPSKRTNDMTEHAQAAGKKAAPDLTPPGKTTAAGTATAIANGGQQKGAAANKEPKPPRESNFKKVYPDTARIHVLTDGGKNPKREGSKAHGRFALYAAHKTVGEYIKAGGTYSSLSWDTGHGFIRVEK